jgi:hypothetical protein
MILYLKLNIKNMEAVEEKKIYHESKIFKAMGVIWYYCLIPKDNLPGVFSNKRINFLQSFIVCWDHFNTSTGKNSRIYTAFKDYLDFAKFYLKIDICDRSFYEIILGENTQKPHFDIDMEITDEINKEYGEKVLNDLLNVIVELIPNINLAKDICIYSSHGEKKISYHVIINHFCHANNKEAKAFYYTVMNKLPVEYFKNNWIDHSVYSKTQQFRIYGCAKTRSNRVKIFHNVWLFNGQKIIHEDDENIGDDENENFLMRLEESLVAARISNCKILPSFQTPDQFIKNKEYPDGENVDQDLAMEALNLLAHSIGMTADDSRFPYRYDKVEGPFVILKRIRPSKCRLCARVHHHQNPYLIIVPDSKNVFFHCRRAPTNRKLYVGCLKSEEEDILEKGIVKGRNAEGSEKGKEEENIIKREGDGKEDESGKGKEEEEDDEENERERRENGRKMLKMSLGKGLQVIEGSIFNIEKDKENAETRNNWLETNLARLREIASSSLPKKEKKEKKKIDMSDKVLENIIEEKNKRKHKVEEYKMEEYKMEEYKMEEGDEEVEYEKEEIKDKKREKGVKCMIPNISSGKIIEFRNKK